MFKYLNVHSQVISAKIESWPNFLSLFADSRVKSFRICYIFLRIKNIVIFRTTTILCSLIGLEFIASHNEVFRMRIIIIRKCMQLNKAEQHKTMDD